jgi:hypothetical protein
MNLWKRSQQQPLAADLPEAVSKRIAAYLKQRKQHLSTE